MAVVAGVGFLTNVVAKVREFTDDPDASAKFGNARIIDMIRRAWGDTADEINRVSTAKIRARVDIAIVADQREYVLPPNVSTFLEFKKLDSNGSMEWEIKANHPLSPRGPGFTIEGPMLRLDPVWKTGYTMRVVYTPSAEATIFEASATVFDASTVTTPASVVAGTVDVRPNAYVGYTFRVLSEGDGTRQDRVVASQVPAAGPLPAQPVFTLKPDFSPELATPVVFELVPMYAHRFEDAVALKVSRFIASVTGDKDRAELLQGEFHDALRFIRLAESNKEGTRGHRFTRVLRGRGRWGKTV